MSTTETYDDLAERGAEIIAEHNGNGHASIEEQAAEPEPVEEEDGQRAIDLGDLPPTLAKLIPKGAPVEVLFNFSRKGDVPGGMGLPRPDDEGQCLIDWKVKDYKPTPVRNAEGVTDRFKLYVNLAVQRIRPVSLARLTRDELLAAGVRTPEDGPTEFLVEASFARALGLDVGQR